MVDIRLSLNDATLTPMIPKGPQFHESIEDDENIEDTANDENLGHDFDVEELKNIHFKLTVQLMRRHH